MLILIGIFTFWDFALECSLINFALFESSFGGR